MQRCRSVTRGHREAVDLRSRWKASSSGFTSASNLCEPFSAAAGFSSSPSAASFFIKERRTAATPRPRPPASGRRLGPAPLVSSDAVAAASASVSVGRGQRLLHQLAERAMVVPHRAGPASCRTGREAGRSCESHTRAAWRGCLRRTAAPRRPSHLRTYLVRAVRELLSPRAAACPAMRPASGKSRAAIEACVLPLPAQRRRSRVVPALPASPRIRGEAPRDSTRDRP